jgi:hypothetical protein
MIVSQLGKNFQAFLEPDGSLPCHWAVTLSQSNSFYQFFKNMLANLMRKIVNNQVKWGGEEKSTYSFFRHSPMQLSQFLSEL